MSRVLVWFSCGAASAVAAKLALVKYPDAVICNTFIKQEHPDNARFLGEVETWLGRKTVSVTDVKFGADIYEVFRRRRFIKGPHGAQCTVLLKKKPREDFQHADDLHVFGYDVDEQHRLDEMLDRNPTLRVWCPLIDATLSKADCKAMIERAGIQLPAMYRLGYRNNNCIGCVKGGAGYWNKIRRDFPDTYEEMARVEEEVGHYVNRVTIDGVLAPVSLRQLPPNAGDPVKDEPGACSIFCHMAEQTWGEA